MKKEKVIQYIEQNMCSHKAEYLNSEGIRQYSALSSVLTDTTGQDIGLRRTLREAFMKQYGLSEIEAVNLMNGFHAHDYLVRYAHLKQCDEMRLLIFKELQRDCIPDEISNRQADAILDVMVRRKIDKKLLALYVNDDRTAQVQMFLKDILEKKESKRGNHSSVPDENRA